MKHNFISETDKNRVVALSDTEVGKMKPTIRRIMINVITNEEVPWLIQEFDADSEMEKLIYANNINNLLVRFIRREKFEDGSEMLVMERLYPIEYKKVSKNERIKFFDKFYAEIKELHRNGFLHGDIMHPVGRDPLFLFDNIILTESGLRLIDTGFSLIKKNEPDIIKYIRAEIQENQEISIFGSYFTEIPDPIIS